MAVDVMVPLPVSSSGHRFIVVIQDYFTKWVEANRVTDHKVETLAIQIVGNFFIRFGLPRFLHSYREFESALFQELRSILEIDKIRTSPWRPQCDGIEERFNRNLETMLRRIVADDQLDCDCHLPLVCMTYRAVVKLPKKAPSYHVGPRVAAAQLLVNNNTSQRATSSGLICVMCTSVGGNPT